MKTLSGYVLVKETNTGVPNLVVEAYDTHEHTNQEPTSHARKTPHGRRLGSALTNTDGAFLMSTADLEFQGNESRPNLVIVISAPEDVLTLDSPAPDVPENRILFVSARPRFDVGAEEVFLIRLLRAQLVRFQIPFNSGGSRVAGAVEGVWDVRDTLKERLAPRLKAEHDAAERRREAAARHVAGLSAIPRHLRDGLSNNGGLRSNALLVNGKAELSDKLETLQTKAIADGLARFETSSNKPTVRLHLTNTELAGIGLRVKGTNLQGKVDPQALAATIRKLTGGVDLVRVRGIDNPSADELQRRYLAPPPSPTVVK